MIKLGCWSRIVDPTTGYEPDWNALTHVAYFGWELGSTGAVSAKDSYTNAHQSIIETKTHANGLKYIVGAGSGVAATIDTILANQSGQRTTAVNAIVALINSTGADGVVFDFEYPSLVNTVTGLSNVTPFQDFMSAVYTAVKANDSSHVVMLCTPPYITDYTYFENANLKDYLDAVVVMGYDYYWNGPSGSNCPLYASETRTLGMKYGILEQVGYYGADKVIFALPFYGYMYDCASEDPGAATTNVEEILLKNVTPDVYGRKWDTDSNTPYYSYQLSDSASNTHVVISACDTSPTTTYDYGVTRTLDTSRKYEGTGSWKCVASQSGDVYMLMRNSPALNISSANYFCVNVFAPAGKSMVLRLFTSSDDDYVNFSFTGTGTWQTVQFPFGDATSVSGTFNPASVLDVRIDMTDAVSGDTYNVDNISTDTEFPTYRQVWYEDSESLALKYQYIKDQELAGVGIWAVGYEDVSSGIWDVFLDSVVLPTSEVKFYRSDILRDGSAQLIVIPLEDLNREPFTGTVTDLSVNLILNNGSDTSLSTTCVYSATAGGHKLQIPYANITTTGKYSLCVSGSNIQTVIVDGIIVHPESTFATAAALSALNNISQAQVLTQVTAGLTSYGVSTATNVAAVPASIFNALPHTYTTPRSFGRLFYIQYCADVGSVVNTQSTRTIKDNAGTTLVTNAISSTDTTVTRTGGHET